MLETIRIRGYKSFEKVDVTLDPINIFIGANGAGKSNFVLLFVLLNRIIKRQLQTTVPTWGGANRILHYGRKVTDSIEFELSFVEQHPSAGPGVANGYQCSLYPTDLDDLNLVEETVSFHNRAKYDRPWTFHIAGYPHPESRLTELIHSEQSGDNGRGAQVARHVMQKLETWRVYHFHDTTPEARVKQWRSIFDNAGLQADASNLAAYLYRLHKTHPTYYERIVATIRLAAPFFGDFTLRPNPLNPEIISLLWEEVGSDMLFGPNDLSDGTLRFACLATLFLQPRELMPDTIILDEPELGLHPYAIGLLADMIRSAAQQVQVIVCTQSVTLLNHFTPEDVLVLDRARSGIDPSRYVTTVGRLDSSHLGSWLEEYGVGDLWEKNVVGGRPQ